MGKRKQASGLDYLIVAIIIFILALFLVDDDAEVQAERDRISIGE